MNSYKTTYSFAKLCTFVFLTLTSLFSNKLLSQENKSYNLKTSLKKLQIDKVPFDQIEILDNRNDTSEIFLYEDGTLPVKSLHLTTEAIKEYFYNGLKNISKEKKTILLNLTQLRVSNKTYILRRGKKREVYPHKQRDYIMFSAEVYFKIDSNKYRKIVVIDKEYYTFGSIEKTVPAILTDFIEATGSMFEYDKKNSRKRKEFTKDSSFSYSRDTTCLTIDDICHNLNINHKYPIIDKKIYQCGVYLSFDDFKNDILYESKNELSFDDKDSVYLASIENASKDFPWAISDNGNLYILLFKNIYLPLVKIDNTFSFYVPKTLPNMYTLLSIEEFDGHTYSSSPSADIWTNLIDFGLTLVIESLVKKSKQKQFAEAGIMSDFRKCFIDMYSGDFIFKIKMDDQKNVCGSIIK